MADNPYAQPQDFAGEAQYLEPKTSILAIFAFVISLVGLLVCCIPGIGPLGLLLGVVALVLISTSGGRKKGGGFAIAAIIIGLISGAINIAVVYGMAVAGREYSALGGLVEAVENRDLNETQSFFISAEAQMINQATIEAWGGALNADYGAMQPRPTGMLELIMQFADVGQRIESVQADVEQEYPSGQFAGLPLALPFDQGSVLFMHIMPADANGIVGSIVNSAYEAPDGSIVWLLPPPSGQGTAAPAAPPAGTPDPADQSGGG
ncbi:MAG: hypothetical protein AAFV77_00750 [Planctomycetota bacterium]